MIISMAEDIECSLHSINQRVLVKENRIEMVKAMRNIVEFHSKAIQLSQISSQIFYSPIDWRPISIVPSQIGQIFFRTVEISIFNHICMEHHRYLWFIGFNWNWIG